MILTIVFLVAVIFLMYIHISDLEKHISNKKMLENEEQKHLKLKINELERELEILHNLRYSEKRKGELVSKINEWISLSKHQKSNLTKNVQKLKEAINMNDNKKAQQSKRLVSLYRADLDGIQKEIQRLQNQLDEENLFIKNSQLRLTSPFFDKSF